MTFEEHWRELRATRPMGSESPDNLVLLERVDSTNRLARKIADEYFREALSPPPTLLLAHEQTGGRGRRGRSWSSPPGQGVYATLLLPIDGPERLGTLPMLVAVGLARALGRHLDPGSCAIKWPNDLMVRGRKIGGVLIEAVSRSDGSSFAMIGFGVNRGQGRDELPGRAATSLALETPEPPRLGPITWEMVDAVTAELEHLGETAYAVSRYREMSIHRPGERLSCRLGEETVEGTFQGFDDRGSLLLATDGGERRIAAGEVIER